MTQKTGKLIGIGLGPGASDLITLRALKHIQTLPVLAIPQPNAWTPSLAFRIIREHLLPDNGQEHLFLEFPMSRDPEILVPAWTKAFAAIRQRLESGLDVGFVTQGDPFVFSTFIYVFESLKEDIPGLVVEMVPGVSSINAVPNVAGRPLVDGQERLAVIPATYGVDDLRNILRSFDSIVLMKVSSIMPQIVQVLEEEDLLDASVYVEKATTEDQRIIHDLRSIRNDRCVYFSMVVVTKKHRSGILRGDAPKSTLEAVHAP